MALNVQKSDRANAVLILDGVDDTSSGYLVLTADGEGGLHDRSGGAEAGVTHRLEAFDGVEGSGLVRVVFVGFSHCREGLVGDHCLFLCWGGLAWLFRELESLFFRFLLVIITFFDSYLSYEI